VELGDLLVGGVGGESRWMASSSSSPPFRETTSEILRACALTYFMRCMKTSVFSCEGLPEGAIPDTCRIGLSLA